MRMRDHLRPAPKTVSPSPEHAPPRFFAIGAEDHHVVGAKQRLERLSALDGLPALKIIAGLVCRLAARDYPVLVAGLVILRPE